MEGTLQEKKQESEYKNPNEEQGGIRRRLRDRDLLRKRKAEAEEKETNQMESQRKRPRADSGTKRRGRPKRSAPTPEISVIQEEEEEAPAVVVVPAPAEVDLDQTPGSLTPLLDVESQPSSVLAALAPQPVFGSVQSPVFAPTLTSPAPVKPTPAFFSPSAPSLAKVLDTSVIPVQDAAPASADPKPSLISLSAPASSSAKVLDTGVIPTQDPAPAPVDPKPSQFSSPSAASSLASVLDTATVPVQESAPAQDADPVPVLTQAAVPAAAPPAAPPSAAPSAPPQVETVYTESQGREATDPVLIEDLGPDEEEDIAPPQDKRANEDLIETPSISVSEQNQMFSTSTLTSTAPQQKYFSEYSF
ncbi:fibrous sheath CABYR-binding protein isoform X2 [Plectropomus leopardus]|uniref:fibrous sheath CABYR-binding protein isoform X2 n=1 Tax=Plectropomus leopardus TaxID=160734 RepID=UPI001C4BEA86|nr:fibrous sheath CABYR-binding protein isoform X2 [Plectropomus leopardus]